MHNLNLPPGADPYDPRLIKAIQGSIDNFYRGGSGMPPKEIIDNENYANMIKAQTAAIVADIRQVDSILFLNALKEIRSAMSTHAIGEGDKGSTERPPIEPGFDEINHGKLQEAYLSVVLRYVKYIDTVCERDFEYSPPKSLADKDPEIKAEQPVKRSRKKPIE